MPKVNCRRKGCTRIRTEFSLFLSRRRTPQFEGLSFCSETCLLAHFESELNERWNRLLRDKQRKFPRPRLGTILLQTAFITADQLDEAIDLQKRMQQGRIGEWLLRLGFVEEHQITLALSKQYGLPLINLRNADTRNEAVKMIPGKIAKCNSLLPVGYDDSLDSLRIAVSAPINFNSQEAIRRMVRKGILPYIGDESAIKALLEEWYDPEDLDLSSVPTFSSFAELIEIGREVVATASEQRAINIQAELLEDFFWIRLDFGDNARHFFCRRQTEPLNIPAGISDRQLEIAHTVAH
jgi:hypothetical protein